MSPADAAWIQRTADRIEAAGPSNPVALATELVDCASYLAPEARRAVLGVSPVLGWRVVAAALRDIAGEAA